MTSIDIERLTEETLIRVAGTRDAARAVAIRFDGFGYGIDLRYGQSDEGYGEYMYVDAGGSVEFEGVGEPVLRDDVTLEEWQAKSDQVYRDNDRLIGELAALQGYVPQPVDEARRDQFFDAMERALFPSLEAAE